jgi:hypothetical protein
MLEPPSADPVARGLPAGGWEVEQDIDEACTAFWQTTGLMYPDDGELSWVRRLPTRWSSVRSAQRSA